jgi:UDP-N-acetylglucosamine transferase subunit ALG13
MTAHDIEPPLNVFVTVGTHEQGFPRMLDAVTLLVAELPNIRWRVQSGPVSPALPTTVETKAAYGHDDMERNYDWADVTISQASPGTVFGAIAALSQPLVMARRAQLSEHVDDHQVLFASHLEQFRLALVADDARALANHIVAVRAEPTAERNARLRKLDAASRARTRRWVQSFDRAVRAHQKSR